MLKTAANDAASSMKHKAKEAASSMKDTASSTMDYAESVAASAKGAGKCDHARSCGSLFFLLLG